MPGLPARWGDRLREEIDSGDLDDLLSAAEKITQKLGGRTGRNYKTWLAETVGSLRVIDSSAIQALASFGVPIATTNYDSLIEEVSNQSPVTWRDVGSIQQVIRGDREGVIHLHGHWENSESVVLGIRSYDDILGDETVQALQTALAMTRTLVFVGFGLGLDDPNFSALRLWMRKTLSLSPYRHYRLAPSKHVEVLSKEHAADPIQVVSLGDDHGDLSNFLRSIASKASREPASPMPGIAPPVTMSRRRTVTKGKPGIESKRPVRTMHLRSRGAGRESFISLLAGADELTIVGLTQQDLAEVLAEAFRRRQARLGGDAAWSSVRLVFASDSVLAHLNDELLLDFPHPDLALAERARRSSVAKRAVSSFFLRADHADMWSMHEYPFVFPFIGVSARMPNGRCLLEIGLPSPGTRATEWLYLQVTDRQENFGYFDRAFEEILRASVTHNEVVLVGKPARQHGSGFLCTEARFRRSVLVEGANVGQWLAAIIVVLWCRSDAENRLLLQRNTPTNSTRELQKLSHVSGYVNQQDVQDQAATGSAPSLLDLKTTHNAVRRELREELGLTEVSGVPEHLAELRFHYPSKESLYFFVFGVEVAPDEWLRFPPTADVSPWPLDGLMDCRRYQVLETAARFLRSDSVSEEQLRAIRPIVSANLEVHGETVLAEAIRGTTWAPDQKADVLMAVDAACASSIIRGPDGYSTASLRGMAGLLYREFFSEFLPMYARIGVADAQVVLDDLASDPRKRDAISFLQAAYGDEHSLAAADFEP